MTHPYTPVPQPPRPGDSRPLHKRQSVWLGGLGLFMAGALLVGVADKGQQPVDQVKAAAAPTMTATVTATPKPGPTVTETVEAKAEPAPTVTVTKTARARAADTGTSGGSTGGETNTGTGSGSDDSTGTCSIVSNSGNCYAAGQFCRNADHGKSTTTASGSRIKCVLSANAWRWTYS